MTPRASAPRLERPVVWLLLAGLAVCLAYLAVEAWLLSGHLGFPLDDSWIHLQFARNLASGHGLSYNPGELVTGSTAPLWTAILSLLLLLPGNVVVWTKLAGIVLYLAGLDATYRLGRELGLTRGLAALATGFTLATTWLVWAALSGMEIPLFVFLSLWGMILHLRERASGQTAPLSLGVLAAAALARPEGFLLLVLALLDRCLVFTRAASGPDDDGAAQLTWRRPAFATLVTGLGLAVCALAGPLLFYRWAGGSFLPTTYAAKGGELRHFLPDLQYVYVVLGIFFRSQPYMTLLAVAGVVSLVARLGSGPARDRGLLPALWLVALPLAYSTLSPPGSHLLAGNFGRYYFPLFPVLAVLGTVGLAPAAATLGARVQAGASRLPLGALLVVLLLWPTAGNLLQGAGRYAQNVANVEDSDVKMARWLAPRLPREAVLAVNDIGALKFLLPNRVIDLAGIANPEIPREMGKALAARVPWSQAMFDTLARRRPDYLVIFPAWFSGLAHDPRFPPVHVIQVRDNITMGGDTVVVYATPWTRHPLRPLAGDAADVPAR